MEGVTPGNDELGERVTQLTLGHLDALLSDDEFAELERLLAADPEAREIYAKLAWLDTGLREGAAIIPMPEARVANVRRFPLAQVLSIAAAIALAALLLGILLRSDRGEAGGSFVSDESGEIAARGVAVITAQAGARWLQDDGRILTEGVSLEPGLVKLVEGLAQIDFYGGASLTLSGPAELELLSADEAVLHKGKMRANVPPAARGFEIRTGDVLIEDLGTSFGLAVTEDLQADLVVFDGEVRATGTDGKAISFFGGDSAHLEDGEALENVANATDDRNFPDIASVIEGAGDDSDSRYAVWKHGSEARRSDPRLVAYYDFEGLTSASRRLQNRAVFDAASELDGGIVGARLSEGRWSRKTALDFRREGDRVRFQIPGEFDALTLYVWVRIDALDRHLNSLFLTDYYDQREIHWQISRKGCLHFATSPMGVENLDKYNRRFYSDKFWDASMSGQWWLLATTVDRDAEDRAVTHYINGEPVGFSGGSNRGKPLSTMQIGRADLGNWSDPIWPEVSMRALNGRIDEFAIFRAVLSPLEIREIYEQGKP